MIHKKHTEKRKFRQNIDEKSHQQPIGTENLDEL